MEPHIAFSVCCLVSSCDHWTVEIDNHGCHLHDHRCPLVRRRAYLGDSSCDSYRVCRQGHGDLITRIYRRAVGGSVVVSCPDPTHSNEEKGLVLFEQFLGLSSEFWEANIRIVPCDLEK